MTLKQSFWFVALMLIGQQIVSAEIIELKDKATVNGKILTEKRDQVAVDIGYTVLVIPRNQIAKISKGDAPESPPKRAGSSKGATGTEDAEFAEIRPGFYSTSVRPATIQNVRDLVNLIGEAVVQVRTPSGRGSGFIIN